MTTMTKNTSKQKLYRALINLKKFRKKHCDVCGVDYCQWFHRPFRGDNVQENAPLRCRTYEAGYSECWFCHAGSGTERKTAVTASRIVRKGNHEEKE